MYIRLTIVPSTNTTFPPFSLQTCWQTSAVNTKRSPTRWIRRSPTSPDISRQAKMRMAGGVTCGEKKKASEKKETVRLRYDKTTLPARGLFTTRRLVRLAFYMYSLEESRRWGRWDRWYLALTARGLTVELSFLLKASSRVLHSFDSIETYVWAHRLVQYLL